MTKPYRLKGKEKMAVELGPLIVFFIGYFMGGRLGPMVDNLTGQDFFGVEGNSMYLAVAMFLPAFAVAFVYSVIKEKRVAPMLMVSGVIIGVLGSLTLILRDKTFFYMKPTITYLLFAGVLAGGLMTGRNFLRMLFDGALKMPEIAWRTLTWRFALMYLVMAVANEIAWRYLTAGCVDGATCGGEAAWINIKLWGFTAVYFIFIAANAPFIAKHMEQEEKKTGEDEKASEEAVSYKKEEN